MAETTTLESPEQAASLQASDPTTDPSLPTSVDELTLPDLSKLADFRVYTAAVAPSTPGAKDFRFTAVGSSTIRDLEGDTIELSGLQDMCAAPAGMALFVNHSYNVPEDVVGFLSDAPRIQMSEDIADLFIATTLIPDVNPRAKAVGNGIYAGVKQGVSVGCLPLAFQFWDSDNKVVTEPDFWDIVEGKLSLHVLHLQILEWSFVGLPANPRSWVQDAAMGLFQQSLRAGNVDHRLASIVKSHSPNQYAKVLTNLDPQLRAELMAIAPRKRQDGRNILWDSKKKQFSSVWYAGQSRPQALTRDAVVGLLTKHANHADPVEPMLTQASPTDGDGPMCKCDPQTKAMACSCGPDCDCRAGACPTMTNSLTESLDDTLFTEEFDDEGYTADGYTHEELLTKASDEDKAAQQARSDKYHIGIKDGGHVTKPGKWSDVPDGEWGDPVNYRYPMPDKSHADNAASRWGDASNRSQYSSSEQKIIGDRIDARQAHFGESSDSDDDDKAASLEPTLTTSLDDSQEPPAMPTLVKATDGNDYPRASEVHVDSDGTHPAAVGSHTHPHTAMGNQGDDGLHKHAHTHDGEASHDHHSASDPDGDGDNDGGSDGGDGSDGDGGQKQLSPSDIPQADPQRDALLAAYNSLGAALGFSDVDTTGKALHPVAGRSTIRKDMSAEVEQEVRSGVAAVDAIVDKLMVDLGIDDPDGDDDDGKDADPNAGTFGPDSGLLGWSLADAAGKLLRVSLLTKAGARHSASDIAAIQVIHDQCVGLTNGSCCPATDGDQTAALDQGLDAGPHAGATNNSDMQQARDAFGAGATVQFIPAGVSPIKSLESLTLLAKSLEEMTAAFKAVTLPTLEASYQDLQTKATTVELRLAALDSDASAIADALDTYLGTNLGRPTQIKRAVTPGTPSTAGLPSPAVGIVTPGDPETLEAPAIPLTDKANQTEVRYINGVGNCRFWPDGVGKGYRPALSQAQMVNIGGIDAYLRSLGYESDQATSYNTGRAALVPIIMPSD